jgi:acetyltransferase-like isoleucine patch superfamily enzyme
MNPLLIKNKYRKLFDLLSRGYKLRELIFKFISLFVFSRIKSFLFYFPSEISMSAYIHYSVVIDGTNKIRIGKDSYIQNHVWLTVPIFLFDRNVAESIIEIGERVRIGRRSTIAAVNKVQLQDDVLLGPNVTILDHIHNYRMKDLPIADQGVISGGGVVLETGCWVGANAVICSRSTDLIIGRNSVVAANSVVRESVPPYTIVSGNPAKVVGSIMPK